MSMSILGFADLVRAMSTKDDRIIDAAAKQLGLIKKLALQDPTTKAMLPKTVSTTHTRRDLSGYPTRVEDIAIWVPTKFEQVGLLEDRDSNRKLPAYYKWTDPPTEVANYPPLSAWNVIAPRLRDGLATEFSSSPDIRKLVTRYAKRELIATIPKQQKRRWGDVRVVCDTSYRLIPFAHDQQVLVGELQKLLTTESFEVVETSSPEKLTKWLDESDAVIGSHILVLGDFGCLSRSPRLWQAWLGLGRGEFESEISRQRPSSV